MMRFDRFTERAQEAAQRAAEIIQRYGHNQIDTEHILLALIEQPGGVIPQILEKLSVSPEALTERLDATLRASPKANIFGGGAGQIFITPRVKRIIDLANEEAKSRIWGGIHFEFESEASMGACSAVADYVVDNMLRRY